jgi:glycosyltransferase involved in cell wall biosynthesis
MRDPAFTVVTKAYNEEELVGEAIGSALAQTREDFELYVVDDGSTDRTAEVVRGFESDPRVHLLSQPNRGVAAAMNAGIAAGTAPYVALLDADDLWMPGYLEQMGAALEAEPAAGFAYTDAWWLDCASGRFFRRTISEYMGAPERPPSDPGEFLTLLMRANWLFGLATIRREALQRVGGVDEALRGSEDYDLWIRLLAAGYEAVRVPGRLAVQRDRSSSLSADESGMLTSLRQVYAKALDLDGVPEPARRLASERLRATERGLEAVEKGRLPARDRVRGLLGRSAKRLLPRRYWHSETPPEVAAAFPRLTGGRS